MEDTEEAPLSPVLNNSRRNLKLIAKRKSKLISKYSQVSSESQDVIQLSNYSSSQSIVNSASPEKEKTSLEDRLKRCKDAQNNKKFCYDIAASSSKFAGKNSPEIDFNASSFSVEDTSVILQENTNKGFKFSSGKDVSISERSLKRASKIFEDIIEDNVPLNTLKSVKNDNTDMLSGNTQITDTQMCCAAENAENLIDFMDNWDVSPQNKENDSFIDDFEISTQETNRLFSDITQNIVNNSKSDAVGLENIEIDINNLFFGFSEEDILVSSQIFAISRDCCNQMEQKMHCLKRNEAKLFKKPVVPLRKIMKKSPKRLKTNEILTRSRKKSNNLTDSQNMPSTSKNDLKTDEFVTEAAKTVKVYQNKMEYNRKRSRNIFEGIEDLNVATLPSFSNFSTASRKISPVFKNVLKTKNIFKDIENLESIEPEFFLNETKNIVEDNLETFNNAMFATASGKKCAVSEKNLLKAKNMFKDIENIDKHAEKSNTDEMSSFPSDESEIFLDETKHIVQYNGKTNAIFATASGKKCAVSEKKLLKAKNMFKDIENIDEMSSFPSVESEIFLDETKHIVQYNEKTNAIFATASGKKCAVSEKNVLKAKNIFKDIENIDKPDDISNNEKLSLFSKVETFTTASGKKSAVSEKNLEKAKNIFQDIDSLENPEELGFFSSFLSENVGGFSTGSGKKCPVSETGLKRNIFEDIEQLELKDLNENVEHLAEKKYNTKNSNKTSSSSPNLRFNSPINSANTSTPILRKTLASKSLKKRNLGMSSTLCRQIDISENQIKRAKLNFEDIEPSPISHYDLSPKIDKNPFEIWNKDIVNKKETEKEKNAAETTITNEDLNNLVSARCSFDFKLKENNYCFQELNLVDLPNYYSSFEKRIKYLEKELSVIKLRMDLFQKQQSLLKNTTTSDHKRQRRGVLFTKKQKNNLNRLSIQKYVRSQRNIYASSTNCKEILSLDSFLLEVTSNNALNVHLHVPWWNANNATFPPVIKTEDGATVIPNHLNYVGITEIQNAVLTMPGVDASLVPDNWVRNHFKWIVWKLVSMERMFPDCFKGCLNVGTIVEQLKYRYDVEIDGINGRPQRSALKMILQRDDVSSRRIVLCVSSIDRLPGDTHRLELTDGWYGIKTTIDHPLNNLINKKIIQIGSKLIIHGADLLNCEGCCPLEIPESTRLQIHYNCTKKAPSEAKLGFTYNPHPFNIPLRCVVSNGGPVSLTSGYIARIYPICFLETCEGGKIWRNKKAEQLRANIWEQEQGKLIERIRGEVEKELEAEYFDKRGKTNRTKVLLKDISGVSDVVRLFHLLKESNDPDSLKELLTPDQCRNLQEYQLKLQIDRQSELAAKIASKLSSTNMEKRNVASVIRILILDINSPNHYKCFSIWRPTETHLQILKEGVAVNLYNIDIKNNSHLSSTSRTQFETLPVVPTTKYLQFNRKITPIEILSKPYFKANFSEFDTIGLVVQISIEATNQSIWLVNDKLEFLSIRIREGPQTCSSLDNLKEGQFVTVLNLIYQKKIKKYVSAEGNLYTVFSSVPPSYYKKNYEEICAAFDKDVNEYLQKCQGIIELHDCETNLLNNMKIESNMSFNNNKEIAETLTASDEEMSLIDTQFY